MAMVALSLFLALSAHAETYTARVVSVIDGDTFKAFHDGREIIVRLRWIDAPEKGQRLGDGAAYALSDLIAGQVVTVRDHGADLHHRRLADVTLADGRNLNRELVRLGWAWWFRKYTKDITLRTFEAEARAAGRGLWADPHPIHDLVMADRGTALAHSDPVARNLRLSVLRLKKQALVVPLSDDMRAPLTREATELFHQMATKLRRAVLLERRQLEPELLEAIESREIPEEHIEDLRRSVPEQESTIEEPPHPSG